MKHASLLIHTEEVSRVWIDRLADNRVPTLGIHPVGGRRANETLQALIETLQTPAYRALLDHAVARGLGIEYEMHAMRYLLPASEFEAHPDWFRMNAKGERTADLNCCASCDEALDYVAERAAGLMRSLYRSTHRYYFWLDDAKDAFCHCPRCAGLSPSDQQMKILNRMIARLRQEDPEACLSYLAYCETIAPPETVEPAEGIFLEYAPYERDFHKPLRGGPQAAYLPALLDRFGRESAKALDYWYDNSYFSSYRKPPAPFAVEPEVLLEDLALYASLGFSDVASFACYLGEDFEAFYGEPDIHHFGDYCREQLTAE